MMTLRKTFCTFLLICGWAATPSSAQEAAPARDSAGVVAIRQSADEFVAAFNRGDAAAVAALWTEDGDYTDESGQVFAGREAIEKAYAEFFKEYPGVKMKLTIDSVRQPNAAVAIEQGSATLEPEPAGASGGTRYTAIHVQVDGKWLMASVRDARIEPGPAHAGLEPLAWLVGSWTAAGPSATAESTCRWIANKSFLQRSYQVHSGGAAVVSGEQMIGWNPVSGNIQSWSFASDGGFSLGTWTPTSGGWAVESAGTTGEGMPTYAVTLVRPLDSEAFAWQSLARSAAGAALPDTNEVVFKRVPPTENAPK